MRRASLFAIFGIVVLILSIIPVAPTNAAKPSKERVIHHFQSILPVILGDGIPDLSLLELLCWIIATPLLFFYLALFFGVIRAFFISLSIFGMAIAYERDDDNRIPLPFELFFP